jgi:hypothetical protein
MEGSSLQPAYLPLTHHLHGRVPSAPDITRAVAKLRICRAGLVTGLTPRQCRQGESGSGRCDCDR